MTRTKKHALFVDDEVRVLEGLRRMLHSVREEWDASFAESAEEALEIIETTHLNVVISDIRMPGVNGVEFFKKIKESHPRIVRIALSGQTPVENVIDSIGPVHQYLPKPCEGERLKATLNRVGELRRLLDAPRLVDVITSLETIPSLPSYYHQLVEEVGQPDASIKKVGEIISQDVGMTVKILQLVNSAFFGLQRHISSPADAAVVLGLDTIKALALSVHVFSVFEQGHFTAFSLDDLREHCIETGLLAKRIARSVVSDRKLADDALIGGMLHDAGKLVMAAKIPGEYANIVQTARHDNTSLAQAEMDALKATHGAVGGYLFGLWGFCAEIIEAVAYHHGPSQGSTREFSALTAVHIADCIISRSRSCEDDVALPRIDELFLDTIGMRDKLAEWELLCPQEAHAL